MKKYSQKTLLLPLIIILIFTLSGCSSTSDTVEIEIPKPEVKVISLTNSQEPVIMEATGTVKPMKSVTIKSLTSGTVTNILVDRGSEVFLNQPLAYLFDETTETNYSSALNSYNIAENSYNSSLISADESVRQAEISLEQATESLEATQSSHNDLIESTTKSLNDTLNNSVINNEAYLNSINNTLDFVDGILGIDQSSIYPGLSDTFSVQNTNLKNETRNLYTTIKNNYLNNSDQEIDSHNIEEQLEETIYLLGETKKLVDKTLLGLYATVTSSNFSQTALSGLITNTITYQNTISANLSSAHASQQGIESLKLSNKTQLDQSASALELAELNYEASQTALENAKQGKIINTGNAESQLQSAQMNLDLFSINKSRQNIIAPFTGVISDRMIEIGDEVSPGQSLFEVSVVNHVKIEISLPSEEISFLNLNEEVLINDYLTGQLVKINPIADPVSKKIQIEIGFDNSQLDLIPETFATVKIPLSKLADRDDIYVIPLKAVDLNQDQATIKIVIDNKIKTKEIKYLQIIADNIIIQKDGLEEGSQVVIENGKMLSDGTEVEIADY